MLHNCSLLCRGLIRTAMWAGTPMNVGNKLRDRPAITLHSHYNAGTAMQNALSDDW